MSPQLCLAAWPREQAAEVEHNRWCAGRLLGGWLPLSPNDSREAWNTDSGYQSMLKNKLRRQGFLVPYKDLDSKTKRKDYDIIQASALMTKPLLEVVDQSLKKAKPVGRG